MEQKIPNYSGCRHGYSYTTAMLHITDDITGVTDDIKCTALILLVYNKAINTIGHYLLTIISSTDGLSFDALNIIKSYLTDLFENVWLDI